MNLTLIVLCVIACAFVAISVFGIISPQTQNALALPASAAFAIAFWELFKQALQAREAAAQAQEQNAFNLSLTTHMADVAFDRHVSFCEAYAAALVDGLHMLYEKGASEHALGIAANLRGIRLRHILWEPQETGEMLAKFEQALRSMGADEYYLKHVPVGEERNKLVHKIHEDFRKIMPLKDLPESPSSDVAITFVLEGLRHLLGIRQLTGLRQHHVGRASQSTK